MVGSISCLKKFSSHELVPKVPKKKHSLQHLNVLTHSLIIFLQVFATIKMFTFVTSPEAAMATRAASTRAIFWFILAVVVWL